MTVTKPFQKFNSTYYCYSNDGISCNQSPGSNCNLTTGYMCAADLDLNLKNLSTCFSTDNLTCYQD